MVKHITIFLHDGTWQADFSDAGPLRQEMLDLWGTTTLPTAFTAKSDATKVALELSARNPGYTIVVPF